MIPVLTLHAYQEWTRITGHEAAMLDRVLPTGTRRYPARQGKPVAYVWEIHDVGPGGTSVFLPVARSGKAVTCLDSQEAANNYEIGTGGAPLVTQPFADLPRRRD